MDYKKDIKDTSIATQRTQVGAFTFGCTLSKKCDRLATAIYLVTNFLSDTEPMKSRLRTLSLSLVRESALLKNSSYGVEINVLENLRGNIEESISLFELAFIAGLVSEMNFTILKREYISLRGIIEVKIASRESLTDTILGDNFFGSPFAEVPKKASFAQARPSTTFHKGQSVGQTNITMSDRNVKTSAERVVQKTHKGQSQSFTQAPSLIQKESRRARILKLVKDNREVTIKDISTHFPDLSEKTIQRELVSLVEEGVLKKSGERRWSRYALV